MSEINDITVHDAHGYTRSKTPWIMTEYTSPEYGRLIHYLAGGGMRTFGRTVRQEEIRQRHRWLAIGLMVLFAIWSVIYFI